MNALCCNCDCCCCNAEADLERLIELQNDSDATVRIFAREGVRRRLEWLLSPPLRTGKAGGPIRFERYSLPKGEA